MKNNKSKTKKVITLIVVTMLIVAGAFGYNFASKFIPKKTNKSVDSITSSDTRANIYIDSNTDGTDDCIEGLISLMSDNGQEFYKTNDNDGIIASNDVVILKINSQWDQRGGTNVDLVKSVIDAIINHPEGFTGEVIIADNGQGQFGTNSKGGRMDWDMANGADKTLSMQDLADSYKNSDFKVSACSWDTITTNEVDEFSQGDVEQGFVLYDRPDEDTKITVSYPKFISEHGTNISFKHGIWDEEFKTYDTERLKVINMPVLKTHTMYGVTGATKGYMGVPSDKISKNSYSTIGIGSMGTLMVETRMPALNIMDAIYINANTDRQTGGPSTNYEDATFTHTVLISADSIALDYYAAGNILYDAIEENGDELELMHQRDSKEVGSFGYWLTLSMNELHKGGYDSVMDESKINIYFSK